MLKENVDGMEPSNEQYNELDNPLLSQPSYTAYTQKAKMVLMIWEQIKNHGHGKKTVYKRTELRPAHFPFSRPVTQSL